MVIGDSIEKVLGEMTYLGISLSCHHAAVIAMTTRANFSPLMSRLADIVALKVRSDGVELTVY